MSTRAAWHGLWLVEAPGFSPLIGPKIFALPGTGSGGPPLDFMCALAKNRHLVVEREETSLWTSQHCMHGMTFRDKGCTTKVVTIETDDVTKTDEFSEMFSTIGFVSCSIPRPAR